MGEARAGPLVEMARDGRGAWRRLEAMGSGGGAVALGRRMKTMDGEKKTRQYIFGGSLVPGEARTGTTEPLVPGYGKVKPWPGTKEPLVPADGKTPD